MTYSDLRFFHKHNAAWKLLSANNAPLILGFFQQLLDKFSRNPVSRSDFLYELEAYLKLLERDYPDESFQSADKYLATWSSGERGWLDGFYPRGKDEPHYRMTAGIDAALQFLSAQLNPSYTATDTKLATLLRELENLVTQSEEDPELRREALHSQIEALQKQLEDIGEDRMKTMDDRTVQDTYRHISTIANSLVTDIRSVTREFEELNKSIREQVAQAGENRAEIIRDILEFRGSIDSSPQGQSFLSFGRLLMNANQNATLQNNIHTIHELAAVRELDTSVLDNFYFELLEANETAQKTLSYVAQSLRRFLEEQSSLESRRMHQLLNDIERMAIYLAEDPPKDFSLELEQRKLDISIPFDRPLFSPAADLKIEGVQDTAVTLPDLADIIPQSQMNLETIKGHITAQLNRHSQASLARLVEEHPVESLEEIVGYFALVDSTFHGMILREDGVDICWKDASGLQRVARSVPNIIFYQSREEEKTV